MPLRGSIGRCKFGMYRLTKFSQPGLRHPPRRAPGFGTAITLVGLIFSALRRSSGARAKGFSKSAEYNNR